MSLYRDLVDVTIAELLKLRLPMGVYRTLFKCISARKHLNAILEDQGFIRYVNESRSPINSSSPIENALWLTEGMRDDQMIMSSWWLGIVKDHPCHRCAKMALAFLCRRLGVSTPYLIRHLEQGIEFYLLNAIEKRHKRKLRLRMKKRLNNLLKNYKKKDHRYMISLDNNYGHKLDTCTFENSMSELIQEESCKKNLYHLLPGGSIKITGEGRLERNIFQSRSLGSIRSEVFDELTLSSLYYNGHYTWDQLLTICERHSLNSNLEMAMNQESGIKKRVIDAARSCLRIKKEEVISLRDTVVKTEDHKFHHLIGLLLMMDQLRSYPEWFEEDSYEVELFQPVSPTKEDMLIKREQFMKKFRCYKRKDEFEQNLLRASLRGLGEDFLVHYFLFQFYSSEEFIIQLSSKNNVGEIYNLYDLHYEYTLREALVAIKEFEAGPLVEFCKRIYCVDPKVTLPAYRMKPKACASVIKKAWGVMTSKTSYDKEKILMFMFVRYPLPWKASEKKQNDWSKVIKHFDDQSLITLIESKYNYLASEENLSYVDACEKVQKLLKDCRKQTKVNNIRKKMVAVSGVTADGQHRRKEKSTYQMYVGKYPWNLKFMSEIGLCIRQDASLMTNPNFNIVTIQRSDIVIAYQQFHITQHNNDKVMLLSGLNIIPLLKCRVKVKYFFDALIGYLRELSTRKNIKSIYQSLDPCLASQDRATVEWIDNRIKGERFVFNHKLDSCDRYESEIVVKV